MALYTGIHATLKGEASRIVPALPLEVGAKLRQPRHRRHARAAVAGGLSDFYRDDVARAVVADLEKVGSTVRLADLEWYQAVSSHRLRSM